MLFVGGYGFQTKIQRLAQDVRIQQTRNQQGEKQMENQIIQTEEELSFEFLQNEVESLLQENLSIRQKMEAML